MGKSFNEFCKHNEVITILEKLCILKNIEIDSIQIIALTTEIIKHRLTRKDLFNAYENILTVSLWNNQLSIEHFIEKDKTDNLRIHNIAVEIILKFTRDRTANIEEYEKYFLPLEATKLLIDKTNELENLKKMLIEDVKNKIYQAITINYEILESLGIDKNKMEHYKKIFDIKNAEKNKLCS